jgi:hypothetical protein
LSPVTSVPFDVDQPDPEFGSIRLQYDNDNPNTTTQNIRPYIRIYNDSDWDINISDLTVRYWFTSEATVTDIHNTEWLEMGGLTSNVEGEFNFIEDNYYLELSFSPNIVLPIGLGGDGTTANLMPSGATTGIIQHVIHSSTYNDYDQSNDYSFNSSITTFTNYEYINVYYKGQLVWGIAPENPQTFYSRQSGDWDAATSWSNESHVGTTSTLIPNTFDTVIIGANHTITITDDAVTDETVTVNETGTLITGVNILSGSGSFILENGGSMQIGSPDGISSSGATGNIQTAIRTFNTGANYRYNGSVPQLTGSGLPTTINNLSINNNFGVYSSTDLIVSGILELESGLLEMGSGTSLVTQSIDSGSGSVKMNLEIDGDHGYRMITSPLATTYGDLFDNFITQGFIGSDYPARQPNILWFMETYADNAVTENQSWRTINGLGDSVVGGRGYFLYVFGNIVGDPDYDIPLPRTMNSTGIEFDFDDPGDTFEFDVTYTSPSLESATHTLGWNLVGNPTMATINWDHEDWLRSNIDETFYIWDPAANSGEGDYLFWNGVTGNNPNEGLISPFQSFWVKSNNINPEMRITHDVKTINGNFIGNQSKVESNEQVKIVKLNLSIGGLSSDIFLTFSIDGSPEIDPYDAYLLESLNSENKLHFYSTTNSDYNPPFVINNLPIEFTGKLNVPIQVGGTHNNVSISDYFTLNWDLTENWPSDWAIVLMDHIEKKAIPMHSQLSYSFWHDTPNLKNSKSFSVNSNTNNSDKYILSESIVHNESAISFDDSNFHSKSNFNSINGFTSSRFTITIEKGVDPDNLEYLSDEPELKNNYPNPFNSSTTIHFTIPNQENVVLDVYDMLGRKVGSLINETLHPGFHSAIWNPGNLASGVYYSRLQIGDSFLTNKMTLVK